MINKIKDLENKRAGTEEYKRGYSRALDDVLNLIDGKNGRIEQETRENLIEDIKDIIIQHEDELEWKERVGIDKALKILQEKYEIE